ncbi:MAG: hypothetical protein ACFNZL_07450, partial [Neisseria sp.]
CGQRPSEITLLPRLGTPALKNRLTKTVNCRSTALCRFAKKPKLTQKYSMPPCCHPHPCAKWEN